MESLHSRCAGLDVHKRSVSACILIQDGSDVHTETAMFGTFTRDLERMRDWLLQHGVQHVAMESTGVFWMPVWNVLEQGGGGALHLTLINPQHVHALPGRKTDRQDCERIAELHQHGLLKGSFIPPAPVRALRDCAILRKEIAIPGRKKSPFLADRNRDSWAKAIAVPGGKKSLSGGVQESLWKTHRRRWTPLLHPIMVGCRERECPCARPEKYCAYVMN